MRTRTATLRGSALSLEGSLMTSSAGRVSPESVRDGSASVLQDSGRVTPGGTSTPARGHRNDGRGSRPKAVPIIAGPMNAPMEPSTGPMSTRSRDPGRVFPSPGLQVSGQARAGRRPRSGRGVEWQRRPADRYVHRPLRVRRRSAISAWTSSASTKATLPSAASRARRSISVAQSDSAGGSSFSGLRSARPFLTSPERR